MVIRVEDLLDHQGRKQIPFQTNVLERILPSSEKASAVMNAEISLTSLLELKEILNTLRCMCFGYILKLIR